MREPEVVQAIHQFVSTHGLAQQRVRELYVDAHPTLTSHRGLQPFQRFVLALDGFSVHPDIVGRFDDHTTFAIEAKGDENLLGGLAQATTYRFGFHQVFLAHAGLPPGDVLLLAQQQHIGMLVVVDSVVQILHLPPAHLPQYRHARAIEEQFVTARTLANAAYTFNLPTHYLATVVALGTVGATSIGQLEAPLRALYPVLPRGTPSLRGALRGAQSLGFVEIRADQVALTARGAAAAVLLPALAELTRLHTALVQGARGATLASVHAAAGAVLRWALADDPVTQVLVAALEACGPGPVSMLQLARAALARDYARALTICFVPETISEITNARGALVWERVEPRHFRSTTFFQYKSLLKHAGIIAPHPLGGASTASYDPAADRWELLLRSQIDTSFYQ